MGFAFATTLFLGSALLFAVQPMVAKAVLPMLGGSPAVWNTCMVFFQAALLAGYAYAHAGAARLGPRAQSLVHAAVLALAALALPPDLAGGEGPPADADPTAWLLLRLLRTVGLPYFAVAATAPMLQRWFAATGRPGGRDPYYLYAASNAGSLLALAAYPLAIEPAVSLEAQARAWSAGFGLLAALIVLCGAAVWAAPRAADAADPGRAETIGVGRRLRWVGLSAVPSSLMLGVTAYLSTDIAAVPLLWVVPLGLYLLSFILTFARRPWPRRWSNLGLTLAALVLAPALAAGLVWPALIPLHLLTFFLAALACHGALADDRPPPGNLTGFYLALAVGGVLGGAFNALVAPMAFDRVAEYPLALVLSLLALPGVGGALRDPRRLAREAALPLALFLAIAWLVREGSTWGETALGALAATLAAGLFVLAAWTARSRPLRFALAVGAGLLGCGLAPGVGGRVLYRERDFFGVLKVTETAEFRRLFHGSTLHGQQALDPARRREPLSYFGREGPIGDVFEAFAAAGTPRRVAIVGLGVGTLAAYARPGERWDFFEIDPEVARIARDPAYFTFLTDAEADAWRVVLGDARLRLEEAPAGHYGLIVLDAFGSDAPPVHLLTREAMAVYRRALAPGGLLAFNLSNRYLDLAPVLAGLAADAGMACRVRVDVGLSPEAKRAGYLGSIWGMAADGPAGLGSLAADPRWPEPSPRPGARTWTDDHTDLVRHIRVGPPGR